MNSDQQYLNLYFQVHQPQRLNMFQFFDVGSGRGYFDDDLNGDIVSRLAERCYLPANALLLRLIDRHPEIKVTFSISGTALEQFERYTPKVLQSFRQLEETGSVEFLGETYYHSLACFLSPKEFALQIGRHQQKLGALIGASTTFFRNTELIYSDAIGKQVSELGFTGMYVEGCDRMLAGRTPNALYRHATEDLVLVPRNYRLSDDVAFRYSDKTWREWPLTGKKFASWLGRLPRHEKMVSLGMDYETFGEHTPHSTGIFTFLDDFITVMRKSRKFRFINPSEMASLLPVEHAAGAKEGVSWADEARDVSAWLGNAMQRDAFGSLERLHDAVMASDDVVLIDAYRHLQTSDHFYYMATKDGADDGVHRYFSPYTSPYEAFMNFMNILADLELRVGRLRHRRHMVYATPPALETDPAPIRW
ncbi:glycoside hydrolase family 57 protein [Dawidia soli]|uniref:Glycoside hydrolase family 57 protein n=1 Tax=Dawidia soli TaxID=2782352 RepID=A0AAP2D7D0_9BACT|nr:glycoside hydrolase family 57 protein [Dawidia soli]MBT1686459.1 glycoside hydrolase family 57 protein [Dawidia soli]